MANEERVCLYETLALHLATFNAQNTGHLRLRARNTVKLTRENKFKRWDEPNETNPHLLSRRKSAFSWFSCVRGFMCRFMRGVGVRFSQRMA